MEEIRLILGKSEKKSYSYVQSNLWLYTFNCNYMELSIISNTYLVSLFSLAKCNRLTYLKQVSLAMVEIVFLDRNINY